MVKFTIVLTAIFSFSLQAGIFDWFRKPDPNEVYSKRYKRVLERLVGQFKDGPLVQSLENSNFKLGDKIYLRAFKTNDIHSKNSFWSKNKDYGTLEIWIKDRFNYRLYKSYPIIKRSGKLGPKIKEGDRQVPEGFYEIDFEWLNFKSRFHLSMNVGYPNLYDQYHQRTGKYIMVHGSNKSIGCLAMGDKAIEEIFTITEKALKLGKRKIPIHIYPFRMTSENMKEAIELYPENASFWRKLKEGYDYFETHQIPPKVKIRDGEYIIKK
jgi:murein L,D-transpeptidase YafK